MMEQSLVFPVTQRRESNWIQSTSRYEFRASAKFPALQKALFWLLGKLGAFARDEQVTYTSVTVDTSKIIDAIMRNRMDLQRLYWKQAKYLVIGAEDFAELMNQPEIKDMLRFSFMLDVGRPSNRHEFVGLEVVVVPWMKGFVVMPELGAV